MGLAFSTHWRKGRGPQEFGAKREREKPLCKTRRRWEYNINVDFTIYDRRSWIGVIWLRMGRSGGI
jgi:hypothetical protein